MKTRHLLIWFLDPSEKAHKNNKMAVTNIRLNKEDFINALKRELHSDLETKSEAWGFKFASDRPATAGKVSWELIPAEDTSRRNASFTHYKREID